MSTTIGDLFQRYVAAHNVEGLEIPVTLVRLYKQDEEIPAEVLALSPEGVTLTSCQATKQASLGDSVCLTKENIGCVAAAISLGLVKQNQETPIQESLVYTDIMKGQAKKGSEFSPPSPKDFTDGIVYACADAKRPDFGLFGSEDVGRFKDVSTAQTAIKEMVAVQDTTIKAVFFYSPAFDAIDIVPDVVALALRPIELSRLIQAYWFSTGKRLEASMGGLRMVNSDLIARPYLTGEINTSPYCMGARLIANWGPNHMGVGAPYEKFKTIVEGMEASQTGYPFQAYPGADPNN